MLTTLNKNKKTKYSHSGTLHTLNSIQAHVVHKYDGDGDDDVIIIIINIVNNMVIKWDETCMLSTFQTYFDLIYRN